MACVGGARCFPGSETWLTSCPDRGTARLTLRGRNPNQPRGDNRNRVTPPRGGGVRLLLLFLLGVLGFLLCLPKAPHAASHARF